MARRNEKSYQENVKRWTLLRKLRSLMQRSYKLTFLFFAVFIVSMFVLFDGSDEEEKEISWAANQIYSITANAGLKLELVTFKGDKYIGQTELVEDLELFDGIPILALDLEKLREKVKSRNWVKDAQIRRELPSKLEISIVERTPIAIWQNKRKLHLIDEEGVVLTNLDSADGLPFPLIVGEGANKEAKKIFAILETEKTLYNLVDSAVRVNERRWNISFMNGVEVLMPETDFEKAWHKLAELQSEKRVLDRDIQTIDLRMPDRVYIRTKDDMKNSSIRSHSA